jgi:hypothetical protein
MVDVAKGVLTGGLGGNHTNMIVGFFHLGPFEVIIGSPPIGSPIIPPVPEYPHAGGGGTRPVHWPDRTEAWDDGVPRTITIRIKYKDEVTERMYVVSSKKAEYIIKVGKFITKTRELINVTVSNVKSRFAKVSVKNMKNKFAEVKEMISIVKTRSNELEFDINITGAQKKTPVVRLVIENGGVNYTFDCKNLKGDKWVCAIPAMPQLTKKSYHFRLEVIIDGYFFEPYKKTLNVIPDPIVKSGKVAEKHPEKPVVKKETKPAAKKKTPASKPVVTKEEVYSPEPVIAEEPKVEVPHDEFADMASAWLNREKPVVSEADKKVKNLIKDAMVAKPAPVVVPVPEFVPPKSALEEQQEKAKLNDIKIKAILDSSKSK